MKRISFPAVVFITIVFLSSACNNPDKSATVTGNKESKSGFDITTARKVIEESNQATMDLLKKGDSVGLANLYCTDAKLMPPNEPATVGKANIQTMFGGFIRGGGAGFSLKTTDIWGSDALIGEEGIWTFADNSGKELDHGKYIVLWKMEDGKWKLFRDCWNSDNPCPK
jgi:ketosteroid isomerase-like protein